MSHIKAFLLAGIISIGIYSPAFADTFPNTNLNNDGIENLYDFAMFANNWQQTGAGLAGDFDDSNVVDIDDLMIFSWFWLSHFSEYQQCRGTGIDLDNDGLIAFEDFTKLAENWLLSGTGLIGDFDSSNFVDCNDLSIFADCWLKGSRPESIWEQFKAALTAGDVNLAISYFVDFVADDYRDIFNENADELQNMVNNMGNLSFEYMDRDISVYEISNVAGTKFYPVVFIQDDDDRWKIAVF